MVNRFLQFAQPNPSPSPGNRFSQFAPLAEPRTFEQPEDEQLYREKLAEEQEARTKPQVPFYAEGENGQERNLTAERQAKTPQQAAVEIVQRQRAEEAEQRAFDESRTPLKRATDASTFALSLPVRMATRGEHGLGDVAGLVLPTAKRVYDQAEANFARANEEGLDWAGWLGEMAAGVPMLSTMGHVPGGISASASAIANKPSAAAITASSSSSAALSLIESRASSSSTRPPSPA